MGKTQHFVEFLYRGSTAEGLGVEKVGIRDPSKVRAPEKCYGFRFFDSAEGIFGEDGRLTSDRRNLSGTYYFGRKMAQEEMNKPNLKLLKYYANLWHGAVKTRCGSVHLLDSIDVVLSN